jgi:hypothetical protein
MDYILPPGTLRLPYDLARRGDGQDEVIAAFPESVLPALTDKNPLWAEPGAVGMPRFRFITPSIN